MKLYQFEECPYCAKVRAKLEELNIDYEKVNVANDREDPQRQMLLEKTGIATVPVLEDDGEFIGDSGNIIEHLENKFSS
tara:strand:- start:339 stop:575 length:237 start_codon:yes stop_codon:yes gene_type:complete